MVARDRRPEVLSHDLDLPIVGPELQPDGPPTMISPRIGIGHG
jgi:hypothetical protein